jgi:hypothetical protein
LLVGSTPSVTTKRQTAGSTSRTFRQNVAAVASAQRRPAVVALAGDERDHALDALRRQAALQKGGVPGLSAVLAAGRLLGHGLGGARRIGRGRGAGVGGVGAQALSHITQGRLEVGDLALQCRNALVALQTTGTALRSHAAIIRTRPGFSGAPKSGGRLPVVYLAASDRDVVNRLR